MKLVLIPAVCLIQLAACKYTTYSRQVPESLCKVYRDYDPAKVGVPIKKPVSGVGGGNGSSSGNGSSCTQIRWDPQGAGGRRWSAWCADSHSTDQSKPRPCNRGYDFIGTGKRLWPNHLIYYQFGQLEDNQKKLVTQAIDLLKSKTCLKFEPCDKSKSEDCLTFHSGCGYIDSRPGREDGGQSTRVADVKCNTIDYVMQKILKAAGMGWAHNRPDRDYHIHIPWEKFGDNNGNKRFLCRSEEDINDFIGIPYDPKSVMHFRHYDAGGDTIYYNLCGEFGHNPGEPLTELDIYFIHKMYNCSTK